VHDQSGIALDVARIWQVVVYAVGIERERRIAEEEHRIGSDGARPFGLRRVRGGLQRWRYRRRGAARVGRPVDDVLLLDDGNAGTGTELVHQRYQGERAAAALLLFSAGDFRNALDPIADPQRLMEAHAPAPEHAPRIVQRRQEIAGHYMTVAGERAFERG